MSTATDPITRTALVRGATYGAGAGIVAALAMGLYAMPFSAS